jgi:hypothetical protein
VTHAPEAIVYPETDEQPLAENTLQLRRPIDAMHG